MRLIQWIHRRINLSVSFYGPLPMQRALCSGLLVQGNVQKLVGWLCIRPAVERFAPHTTCSACCAALKARRAGRGSPVERLWEESTLYSPNWRRTTRELVISVPSKHKSFFCCGRRAGCACKLSLPVPLNTKFFLLRVWGGICVQAQPGAWLHIGAVWHIITNCVYVVID